MGKGTGLEDLIKLFHKDYRDVLQRTLITDMAHKIVLYKAGNWDRQIDEVKISLLQS